jgi:hypothetical protein
MFDWFRREKAPNGERLVKKPKPATQENTDRLDFFKDRLYGLSMAGDFNGINERLVSAWMRQLVEHRTGKPVTLERTGLPDTPETLDYALGHLVGFVYATLSTDIPPAEEMLGWLRELKTYRAFEAQQQRIAEHMTTLDSGVVDRLSARRARQDETSPSAPSTAPRSSQS